jgi:hypothetical protein
MAREAAVTGESGNDLTFNISSIVPPAMSRRGRKSPYAPAEQMGPIWQALKDARAAKDDPENPAETAWISVIQGPLDSESKARNALVRIRKGVSAYGEVDYKAIAGRTWQTADNEHWFALQLRPGAGADATEEDVPGAGE